MLALLTELDRAIFLALFGGEAPGWILYVMLALTIIGRGYIIWAVATLAILPRSATRVLPHRVFSLERQRLARELLLVLVVTAVIVYCTKAVVQRPRPYVQLDLVPLGTAPRDFSFPSGHSAGAFSFATFFIGRLRPSYRATAGLLVFAAGIAISRIYLGAHFPTDVLAGGLLGGACGYFAGRTFRLCAMARAEASGPQLANPGTPEA